MVVFCDSSALVKLYADEERAEDVRSIEHAVVSELARVEVPAALWRKARIGELSTGDAQILVDTFEDDWFADGEGAQRFTVVRATPAVLDAAVRRAAVHGLRAYDAVQISAAVAVREADPDLSTFVSFDTRLNVAARVEGFDVLEV